MAALPNVVASPPSVGAPLSEEARHAREKQACETADQFVNLFYERMDSKRHVVGKLYLASAVLAWNGNKVEGGDAVQNFLLGLPSSEHQMSSLDAQPVHDEAVSGQTTVAVQVAGSVRYQHDGSHWSRWKPFQQNFLLTAEGDKWKVATECFRSQEN